MLGTRPEIIKLARVIRLLGTEARIVYTGQHIDDDLFTSFFESFSLPRPKVRLAGISGRPRGIQIARAIEQLTDHFTDAKPDIVVVQGDTNATSAGAQAANYCQIPVVHVEAGLRSFDPSMPEEINRRVVAMLADMHCAPTEGSAENLRKEGISSDRIRITGNTVVEALQESLPQRHISLGVLDKYDLTDEGYVLATIHRPENTDSAKNLGTVITELSRLPVPVIFPVHPRTMARVREFGLSDRLNQLKCTPPLDYTTFLSLARHARLIVSDSGGIQEECTVLKKPVLVIRNNTERPEAVDAGFAVRVPVGDRISEQASRIIFDAGLPNWLESRPSPFGDGKASERISDIIQAVMAGRTPPYQSAADQFSCRSEWYAMRRGAHRSPTHTNNN
ncbi:non-hydrolyzing UDP-N-acetylglucosamine 2-epimerase [Streptomyces lavendulocolor]|uniref:non-hydrolyzing UDP-N-acetylglucosamine 2-epimerase n=1 Tax=Streptomyces lavendulocolor TaxID=67316 RepID=UPI0033E5870D